MLAALQQHGMYQQEREWEHAGWRELGLEGAAGARHAWEHEGWRERGLDISGREFGLEHQG